MENNSLRSVNNIVGIVKWDGRKVPFQIDKVKTTLLRLGASQELAGKLAEEIASKVYEGIMTKTILDMINEELKKNKPAVKFRRDLRSALGMMNPKPDFEEYVHIILREHGYKVAPAQVIQGFCVTHEIDGIAEKDGKKIYLEVKNHAETHTYTPFPVTLAAKAKWDDIQEGYKRGLNTTSFDNVLIVCNTRFTEHAMQYAKCMGFEHLGWDVPKGRGLNRLIEEKHLYPVTILPDLTEEESARLSESRIYTLRQLVKVDAKEVNIPQHRFKELVEEAKRILEP